MGDEPGYCSRRKLHFVCTGAFKLAFLRLAGKVGSETIDIEMRLQDTMNIGRRRVRGRLGRFGYWGRGEDKDDRAAFGLVWHGRLPARANDA